MPLVRGCRNRWCPDYATGPDGWCDAHRLRPFRNYEPPAPGWPQRRAEHLAAYPLCAICGAEATDVHHVSREPEVLQSLCHSCHATITGREGGLSSP